MLDDRTIETVCGSAGTVIDGADRAGIGGVRIVSDSVSEAWVAAFSTLMTPGVKSIDPLVVTVTGFDKAGRPLADDAVANVIDAELLRQHRKRSDRRAPTHNALTVATAASTIFPESLWNPARPRADLYAKYMKLLPKLKRDSRNKRGIYFERMIAYGRGPAEGNQLENIFQAFDKNVRRTSAYQIVIADPLTDLTHTPFLGFPCLQQIALYPSATEGTLAITGFYATQYLFERGYGNYLGLCRLGRFLAHETGLRLNRMTCIASHTPVEQLGKEGGKALLMAIKRRSTRRVARALTAGASAGLHSRPERQTGTHA